MRFAAILCLGLMGCQSHGPTDPPKVKLDSGLDGKSIVFKGPCSMSKMPSQVYVRVCHIRMVPEGSSEDGVVLTAEQSDGHIQVEQFHYYGKYRAGDAVVLYVSE